MWRIMLEVTGRTTSLPTPLPALEEELTAGPSSHPEYYEAVTREVEGVAYFDDALSAEELGAISGVIKIYTGQLRCRLAKELYSLIKNDLDRSW